MPKKVTTEQFIEKAKIIHGDKYDYSKVKYIKAIKKVIIICKKHGEFKQQPNNHLTGNDCVKCRDNFLSNKFKKSKEQFILDANKVHNDKYDYSKVNYINWKEKVIIICKKHGEFKQEANSHLQGRGCSKCKNSIGETKVENWLKKNNIEYISQYKFLDCCGKTRRKYLLPFDFYLPDKNILIEYDGEQHFSPARWWGISKEKADILFEKVKIRDKIKTEYCKNNNIMLLRIPYIKINDIDKILEDKLL